ncbi:sigma factor-like helix-turn-helix DNA-binding protein [Azospirillum doebereinerae]|uniref:sigma factor-like helix-turn-helix DNA-binding protein n=1 Tax=Azospirillum doebereinerae TaxID=92933 RepID=UPI001FD46EFA|nr:sigma factor-like helix-turn-helix DNA-binding protein [Azospirillum doebereinerae]
MATLKEFEDALTAAGNTEALAILQTLRERDRATRSVRPARRLTGRKMTPELASEVLYLHRNTEMTQQEIAFQLGVNQGRVNEVIKRGKWLDGDPASPEAVARDKAVKRAEKGVGVAPRRPSARKTASPKPGMPESGMPESGILKSGDGPRRAVASASPSQERQAKEPPPAKERKPGVSDQLLLDGI